jgi:acyl-coenzyme A thioesterase 9
MLATLRPKTCALKRCSITYRARCSSSNAQPDDYHSARTATTRLLWKARKERASQALGANSASSAPETEPKKSLYSYDEKGRRIPISKRPLDSLQVIELPFSSDATLREQYCNLFGGIRVGKVLEDLDALAGSIAHAHADLPTDSNPPCSIVTASVDRIMLLDKLLLDRDIMFRGFVSYAGTSSMEVRIDMESKDPVTQTFQPLVLANFTMVATQGGKAVPVNRISAETEEEKLLWELGAENNRRRKEFAKASLQQVPPTSEEVSLVHRLYIDRLRSSNAVKPVAPPKKVESTIPGADPLPNHSAPQHVQFPSSDSLTPVDMVHTRLQSIALCQPQERNTAGKVFGGFLMSKAQELAWSCANIYCGKDRAWFVALDHVSFQRPVEIGSIAVFDAQVIYTASKALCVRVTAESLNAALGTAELCTTFYFTFTCIRVPPVIPKSYEEVLLYIEGKRRFDASQAFAKETSSVVLKPHYGAAPSL